MNIGGKWIRRQEKDEHVRATRALKRGEITIASQV